MLGLVYKKVSNAQTRAGASLNDEADVFKNVF